MLSSLLSGKRYLCASASDGMLGAIEFRRSLTPLLEPQLGCHKDAQVRLDVAHLRLMSRSPAKKCAIIY